LSVVNVVVTALELVSIVDYESTWQKLCNFN